MKTRTANWDYNRPERPAQYNGTCPICSGPCYSGTTPDGKIHTCPKCGHIPGDAAVLQNAADFVAFRDAEIWGDNPDGMETPFEIRASLGL